MTRAPLSTDAYLSALRAATEGLASLRPEDLDTAVAACPGWTVGRLLVHVGRIHRWVAVALRSPAGREVPAVTRPDASVELGAWLLEGVDHLVDAMIEVGPTGRVESPGWEQPAGWWLRRTAHETTMHAWDAQAAVGAPAAIPASLALDGIDEVMDVFVPNGLDRATLLAGRTPPQASLHLHSTDALDTPDGGEWLLTVTADDVEVQRRHAKGDVAVRAGASDLLLLLWNRLDHRRLEVHGDDSLLERYREAARY